MFGKKYKEYYSKIEPSKDVINNVKQKLKEEKVNGINNKTSYFLPLGFVATLLIVFVIFDNIYVQSTSLSNNTINYPQHSNDKLNVIDANQKITQYSSLQEIIQNDTFSQFVPRQYIEGYKYEDGTLTQKDDIQSIFYSFTKGYGYISVHIRQNKDIQDYQARLVDVNDIDKYDITKYEIPFAQTVPEQLKDTIHNPIFDCSQISKSVLEKRIVKSQEIEQDKKQTMQLGISCGEFSVEYNIAYYGKDSFAQKVYDIIMSMPYLNY